MPTKEERHVALAEEKLRRFLILADDMLALRGQIQQQLGQATRNFSDNLRNRVLIGLHLKGLDSFHCLLVDAREKRPECSHHPWPTNPYSCGVDLLTSRCVQPP